MRPATIVDIIDECRHHPAIEALAGLLQQAFHGLVDANGRAESAIAGHANQGIGNTDDAGGDQDLVAGEWRGAGAVPAGLGLAQGIDHRTIEFDVLQQIGAGLDAVAHQIELLGRQVAAFGEEIAGNEDLAEIEQIAGNFGGFDFGFAEAHLLRDGTGDRRHPHRMIGGEGIALIDHLDQRLDQLLQGARATLTLGDNIGDVAFHRQHVVGMPDMAHQRDLFGLHHLQVVALFEPRHIGDIGAKVTHLFAQGDVAFGGRWPKHGIDFLAEQLMRLQAGLLAGLGIGKAIAIALIQNEDAGRLTVGDHLQQLTLLVETARHALELRSGQTGAARRAMAPDRDDGDRQDQQREAQISGQLLEPLIGGAERLLVADRVHQDPGDLAQAAGNHQHVIAAVVLAIGGKAVDPRHGKGRIQLWRRNVHIQAQRRDRLLVIGNRRQIGDLVVMAEEQDGICRQTGFARLTQQRIEIVGNFLHTDDPADL